MDIAYWEEITVKKSAPIPFTGSELDGSRHVCAFFKGSDKAYCVMFPFIKRGFNSGDKANHVVNPDQHESHLNRLAVASVYREVARLREPSWYRLQLANLDNSHEGIDW